MVLTSIAKLIDSITGPDKWYNMSYQFTKQYAKFKRINDKTLTNINANIKLDSLLSLLSASKKSFPIPVKVKGIELFDKPRPNGLILCSVHIPLLPVAMRVLVEAGNKLDGLIVKSAIKNENFQLFGIDYGIPIINYDPNVLIKSKNILRNGGTLVVLTDLYYGHKYYSPNIFYLANQIKADMIYFFAELMPDGHIEVTFHEAPCRENITEEVISRIATLNKYRNKILKTELDFMIETKN